MVEQVKPATTINTEDIDDIVAKELAAIRKFWREKEKGQELPESIQETVDLKNKIRENLGKVFPTFRASYNADNYVRLQVGVVKKFLGAFDKWVDLAQALVDRERKQAKENETLTERLVASEKLSTYQHRVRWSHPTNEDLATLSDDERTRYEAAKKIQFPNYDEKLNDILIKWFERDMKLVEAQAAAAVTKRAEQEADNLRILFESRSMSDDETQAAIDDLFGKEPNTPHE
jgi:hypothetical protein